MIQVKQDLLAALGAAIREVSPTSAMPALFEAMTWGTDTVMEETRQRLHNLGWRWHELPERWDVDRPEDYQRLVREGLMAAPVPAGKP